MGNYDSLKYSGYKQKEKTLMAIMGTKEYAISLPFRIDDFGNVQSNTSQSKIWADRVKSVIGTSFGERVMFLNDYGTQIPINFFENMSEISETIKSEVISAFSTNLPKLQLVETIVTLEENLGTVQVEVLYLLPSREQNSVTVGLATIDPNAPFEERLL
jgi:phage baseplate assembly protein W